MKSKAIFFFFFLMIVTLTSCNHNQIQSSERHIDETCGCPVDENGINILNNTKWEAHVGSVPYQLIFNEKSGEYKIGDSSYSITILFKNYTYDGNTLFLQSTNGEDDQSFSVISTSPTSMTLKVNNNNAAEEIKFKYKNR